MNVFKRRHILPGATWAPGNIQIPVAGIPMLSRIEAFVFRAELVFTAGAAAAAITSQQLARLISLIDIGPNVRVTGAQLSVESWQRRGGGPTLPAGIPATNAGVFRRFLTWTVSFVDLRLESPTDGCPVGADYADKVISIDVAAFASLGAGTWDTLASVTGTLRAEALLLPPNGRPAATVQLGFADLTGQSPSIFGTALYEDLYLFRDSLATIDSAQVATVAIQGDGAQYHDAVRLHEYASRFNELWAKGPRPMLESATVPEAGEMLPEAPAVTNGAAATVALPFGPLVTPTAEGKKSEALQVESVVRLDITGTDTTYRAGYRRVLPHTESSAVAAFQRQGQPVTSLSQIASATGNGKALSGRLAGLARFLPLQRKA